MVFLPEGFDYMSETAADVTTYSEPLTGPVMTSYLKIAKDLNVWLSLGGYHLKDEKEPRAHNSHIIVSNEGKIVEIYRKAHLFRVDIPGNFNNKMIRCKYFCIVFIIFSGKVTMDETK